MEKKDFEAKINQTFTVKLGGSKTVDLTLLAVDPIKRPEDLPSELKGGLKPREEPFSLVFSGSDEMHLPDNTYSMSVEGSEEELIFISAFKDDGKGCIHYDSVFN